MPVTLLLLPLLLVVGVHSTEVLLPDGLSIFNQIKLLQEISALGTSTTCGTDLNNYLNGLLARSDWALLMFDSTAKIPDGFLTGNTKLLGQFDECVGVQETSPYHFSGQHCMMDINLTLSNNVTYYKRDRLFQPLAGEASSVIPLFYGICLPSTCSAPEIESKLNQVFNSTQVLKNLLSVKIDPENCWTSEPRQLSAGDWVVVAFLVFMGVITICSTIYDVMERFYRNNDKPHPLLSSFSVYTNGKFLFQISDGAGQMKALHGMRALSMSWVVLCHAYVMAIYGAAVNIADLDKYLKDIHHVFIINGFVSVDSFFFLSGLLVCFVFFRDIGKKGTYDVLLGYIHRYIRLTPPFAAMILLQVTILIYIGSGPYWHIMFDSAGTICRDNWWSGLLYVQNFVNPNSTCLGQSWYLSADMQMYWISPLILYPLLLWPTVGPFFITIAILGAAFITFTSAYLNDLGPSMMVTRSTRQNEFDYVPFYTRMSPWLVGVAVGYLICGIQAKKIRVKLSKVQVAAGWIFSTGICLGCLYGIVPFNNGNLDYTKVEASFYIAFTRVGWALGLAWIAFACIQGYGGPVNKFLSWGIFQPIGKLSYCAFLIHMTVQSYRLGTVRTSSHIGDFEIIYSFLGDWVLANLISIPFTLIFEIPFMNIDRYLFRNVQVLPFPKPKKLVLKSDQKEEREDVEVGKDSSDFVKSEPTE